jgi:hypothetical protein
VPRARRQVRLSLLLAVAPLIAACDGEGRHCVGPNGVYLADECCEAHAACWVQGAHYVYVPHRSYTGTGTHAGTWVSRTSPSRGAGVFSRGGFGSHGGGGHGGGE